jgi:hypothetical protein
MNPAMQAPSHHAIPSRLLARDFLANLPNDLQPNILYFSGF